MTWCFTGQQFTCCFVMSHIYMYLIIIARMLKWLVGVAQLLWALNLQLYRVKLLLLSCCPRCARNSSKRPGHWPTSPLGPSCTPRLWLKQELFPFSLNCWTPSTRMCRNRWESHDNTCLVTGNLLIYSEWVEMLSFSNSFRTFERHKPECV